MRRSLAEEIIRAESTEELRKIRNGLIKSFASVPNAEELIDRDYHILREEIESRGETV